MKDLFKHMYLWDWIGIGYNLLMASVVIFFHKGYPNWYQSTLSHLLVIGLIFAIVAIYRRFPNKVVRFFRYVYPIILTGYYYEDTRNYIFIIHDGWMDDLIINLETWLFGTELTLLVERLYHPWLTEFIVLGYLSYYPLAMGGPLYIYYKAEPEVFRRVISSFVLTFSLSLPLYFLFPVEGPRWHQVDLYAGPIPGHFFVETAYSIMRCCAVHGGAMPSTHTAVAVVVVYGLWHVNRRLFWGYFPFFVALVVGTVWGRFHYITDTFVGASIALFSIWVSIKTEKFSLFSPRPA